MRPGSLPSRSLRAIPASPANRNRTGTLSSPCWKCPQDGASLNLPHHAKPHRQGRPSRSGAIRTHTPAKDRPPTKSLDAQGWQPAEPTSHQFARARILSAWYDPAFEAAFVRKGLRDETGSVGRERDTPCRTPDLAMPTPAWPSLSFPTELILRKKNSCGDSVRLSSRPSSVPVSNRDKNRFGRG